MKTLMTAAVALSIVASAGAASAQPNNYRQDQRYEQQRPAPQANRRDDGPNQWQRQAPQRYKAGSYKRPKGYTQHRWTHGERLPANYRSRAYAVDYNRYHLAPPPRGYQYTRVDNDVVLTAIATGVIASVIVNMFQ